MARDDDDEVVDDDEEESRPSRPKKRKKPSSEDKQMAMFCHLGGIMGGFLIPLIIWAMKKEESSYVDRHGKEALNFALTMMIVNLITCGCGALVTIPLGLIFHIQAGMAANRGEYYEYPMSFRMIT